MAVTLNPYLSFRGNAREAMEFYEKVFGGKLSISTFKELHSSTDPNEDDLIMHGDLEAPNGLRLMGADVPPRMEYQAGKNDFSISLSGDAGSESELRGYFDQLSEGGTVIMPMEKASWGDTFGMCADRFGVTWLVNVAAPTEG